MQIPVSSSRRANVTPFFGKHFDWFEVVLATLILAILVLSLTSILITKSQCDSMDGFFGDRYVTWTGEITEREGGDMIEIGYHCDGRVLWRVVKYDRVDGGVQ